MTTDPLGRSTVRLVAGLFLATVLLQRFAVPGVPVPLLLPVVLGACVVAVLCGLLDVDRTRLVLWLAASGATALVIPLQAFWLERELVSLTAWALFVVVWTPFVFHLVDRRLTTYVAALRAVVRIGAGLAGACLFMVATQFVGLPYRDWLADVVPGPFLVDGFVITYPITYDSPIYRANAWIGLEPSMVSLQLGVAMVAALLLGSRMRVVLLIAAGLVAATSGSGFAVIAVGVLVLAVSPARTQVRRVVAPTAALVLVTLATPMGQSLLSRLGEGGSDQSSTSLRAIYPYRYLWPTWTSEPSGVLFGFGPGSAQVIVERSGIAGLLVPTPAKIFFEYGLLAGLLLAVMLLAAYLAGPSRALSLSLLVSMWTLQPGTTTLLVLLPVLLLVTWWSPRPTDDPLEWRFAAARHAAVHPPPSRPDRAPDPAPVAPGHLASTPSSRRQALT